VLIAAIQRISFAPATTAHEDMLFFNYVIGSINDELGIDAKDIANGAFYLAGSII